MRIGRAFRWAAIAVLAATAGVVGLAQPASAAPVVDYVGPFYNLHTQEMNKTKAMAVLNASTGNTAPLIQAPYTSAAPNNDRIVVERETQSNVIRLKPQHTYTNDGNVHNDKCLAVKNADRGNNIPIVNATCTYDGTNNDVWIIRLDPRTGADFIENQMTGKCITTKNAATDNAPLITFDCNGGHNGLWVW
ncbi:ricin-type beta-trefoil lectin domain protein [Solwaraspora sp. WMMD1047]|uniref:RICIN domain-containing protein n=1 Tax=Solwaraspora sp. WMMD1047 TaxID=3016102 RepID=UPI0024178574|nr:RICIN domain-containing protein [Solwaraspora sp. WMMD1047]MDG4834240.1 ricin-type beta-trefoil lectin domain protein [Solwaraspora sp. WMMD1047]